MNHNIPQAVQEEIERHRSGDTAAGVEMAMEIRKATGRAAAGPVDDTLVRVRYREGEAATGPVGGMAGALLAEEGYVYRETRDGYGGAFAVYEVDR